MKAPCPICQKSVERKGNKYRPFCSERCKLIDLGHWAQGTYQILTDDQRESKGGKEETNGEITETL